jgi:prepilin-type N-terminal cleavage/methylation domain-containing protein
MSARAERGFTLIEVMLSVVLLTVGVMALVGSSAMVSRMIGHGRESTFVSQRASSRFDQLRQLAASTSPPCTAGGFASGSQSQYGVSESWTVPTSGNSRLVRVVLSYRTARRTVADTVKSYILCK